MKFADQQCFSYLDLKRFEPWIIEVYFAKLNTLILLFMFQMQIKTRVQAARSFKYFSAKQESERNSLGHQTVRAELDHKIELLKAPVYRKKNKKSKTSKQKDKLQQENCHTFDSSGNKTRLNQNKNRKTHYRYESTCYRQSQSKSCFRKSSIQFQSHYGGCEKRTVADVVKVEQEIHRQASGSFQKGSNILRNRETSSKLTLKPNSQSLLRKNSLYLLNYIKRKEKNEDWQKICYPHVAGIPNVAFNIKLNHMIKSPIKAHSKFTHAEKKPKKIFPSSFSKILNSMPIEPW